MKTFREIAEMHYGTEQNNEADKQYRLNRINALEKLLTEQCNIADVIYSFIKNSAERSNKDIDMKKQILKISKDLEKGETTEQEAQDLLLSLFGVSGSYLMGVKEFGLKLDYSHAADGRKFLEVFANDGELKFQEWCKYKDGSFNYR